MREIKFRAWDKLDKEMVGPFDLDLIPMAATTWDLDNFEFLQFTGLKDRKGKEIYEGDIIVSKEDNGTLTAPCKVHFSNGGFKPFCEPCIDGTTDWEIYGPTTEVIGNIWENPELLEAGR